MARMLDIRSASALIIFKSALIFLAGMAGLIEGLQQVSTAHREAAPTKMSVEDLPVRFHGQRWLTLTGRLDLARATTQVISAGEGETRQQIIVPLIAASAGPNDPVRVLLLFESTIHGFPANFLSQFPPGVAGYTGLRTEWDTSLPNTRAFSGPTTTPFITLEMSAKPPNAAMGWGFAGLGAVFVGVAVVGLRDLGKAWLREGKMNCG